MVWQIRAGDRFLDEEKCVSLWLSAVKNRDGTVHSSSVAERAHRTFDQKILRFALIGQEPRGFSLTVDDDMHPGEQVAFLALLAVSPDSVGQGLGCALLDDAILWAQRAKYERLELHVRSNNERAIALYQFAGFSQSDQYKEHPLGGEPMVTFFRSL